MSVVNGIVFLSQFGEERAQSGWGCGWVIEFIAEVEVELHPFMVGGTKGRRNVGVVESAVEAGYPLCRQLVHG